MIGKAAGATAGIPTVAFDLAAMQSSLVGGSGERLRAALQVVDAISQGRSLWIATCNSITTLPPELRRRFTLGTFFFDLPSPGERKAIWGIYLKKWNLNGELPDDEGWTGAEIKECCRKAWRLNLSLKESAAYIVPVSRSAADQIENLRRQASGRFLNASRPGVYTFESGPQTTAPARRVFRQIAE
jgi:SpoVK/Ycf46/Vps4 family AAA+-type ATPase